ncbi:MAG: 3-hydroxybutyryl-CoA dehydrogenase [Peptococcaceae bacterium]|nr:3-hydroxybutyryl-CoA dehydrogenase [Peptococcaceae bacterium]MDH7525378.1 3-hydroxybutyryl-CoA dehydrogenase [Peptococcaceae bacterium]
MKKILVLGAGTMGSAIAQLAAQSGFEVIMRDLETRFIEKGLVEIEKSLNRLVNKGKLSGEEKEGVISRIRGTTALSEGKDADFVIEAVIENMEFKKEVYRELDRVVQPAAILASNTSSLSITELGAVTARPDRVIGMHFFNPIPVMQLVEVIKGAATSEETFSTALELTKKMNKVPVGVKETPGFVVNRLLVPLINEAAFLLMEGAAGAEEIDTAMKLGANHPIGPLALGDLIGLDVCLAVMEVLHMEFGESKYRPCPLLRKMVRAGYLGRKTGRGFFSYSVK